jgi:hypothetical protein
MDCSWLTIVQTNADRRPTFQVGSEGWGTCSTSRREGAGIAHHARGHGFYPQRVGRASFGESHNHTCHREVLMVDIRRHDRRIRCAGRYPHPRPPKGAQCNHRFHLASLCPKSRRCHVRIGSTYANWKHDRHARIHAIHD